MGQKRSDEAGPLEELRKRFDLWGERRRKRGRIPLELLKAAVGLADRYSPSLIAKTLHLNHRRLMGVKSLFHDLAVERRGRKACPEETSQPCFPRFIKIPMKAVRPAPGHMPRDLGMIEFENPQGFKARLSLRREPSEVVGELLKVFVGEDR